ncbi:glycosyltransferase family 2 protein [Pseudomonas pseudonitroreducens]|uniref:glycosyltransferase family 2 protein n=1 Tax=Pseudomonas pseudonitroreducens TaxID=2892326 RepID=UPI001F24022A|nr:glycosyltransferase family A protein [Pseudomonas pseudonitroreducens]
MAIGISKNPLVSIITPTWNREKLLPTTYRAFKSQSYSPLEWIVVDDSEQPSAFMTSLNDPRVIYRHLPARTSIGEKRNIAIELANGEIISHFDDDDIYAKDYINAMLSQMQNHGPDFVKLSAFFLYNTHLKQFAYWDLMHTSGLHFRWDGGPVTALDFPVNYKKFSDNHLGFGFSYIYKKKLWTEQPFEPVSFNEDGLFAIAARDRGVNIALPADETGLCLHITHKTNTSVSFPQSLLPEKLVSRHLPEFREAVKNMAHIQQPN